MLDKPFEEQLNYCFITKLQIKRLSLSIYQRNMALNKVTEKIL